MRLRFRSLATFVAVLVVASVGHVYSRIQVSKTEEHLLSQSADDLGLVFTQLIARIESKLGPLHTTAVITSADPGAFARAAQPELEAGILAAAGLVDASGTRLASAGRSRPAADLDPGAQARLASVATDGGLTFLGLFGTGLGQRMGFAYARSGHADGMAVHAELTMAALPLLLPPQLLEFDEAGFDNLALAVYSAGAPRPDALLFSSASGPLPSSRRVVPIPVGDQTWTLVVAAPGSMASTIERAVPWIVLGFGALAALLLAAVVEVGARRRRDALAAREERFHLLVQQSSDVVTVVDAGTVLSYHSPSAERVFGHASEDLLGQPLAEIVHPDDAAAFRAALDLALTEPGQALFVAVRLRHGAGRWLRFEVAGRDLRHEPAVGGIVLNWLDVTEREEERAARTRLASVLEATPDLVVTTDADHRVVFVNSAGRRLLGATPDEDLTGRRLVSLFPERSAPALGAALDGVLRDGSWMGEMAIATPEGEIPVLAGLVSHRDDDGTASYTSVIARDITERKDLERQLAHQAFHDPLTGLPNRALLNDRLGQALERARRNLEPAGVLLIDLDDFKTVNDSLGHPAGDALLRAAADRVRNCLRASDTLARLGGDEFAVVLDDASGDTPMLVAERIVTAFSVPFPLEQREVVATASVGVAVVDLLEHWAADEALQAADVALYAAKTGGKARFARFQPSMLTAAAERLELHVDLRRAVDYDQLVLHYQPIIEMPGRQVVGVEALLRWNHPRYGLLAPDRFICLAEETGLIVEMGRWVLQRACAQLVEWRTRHPELADLRVSVNVSGRQLEDPAFAADVAAALAETGLPPGLLILEITESVFIQYGPAAELLRELKGLGIRLALDDFGTGYSSFSSLQHLPIDVLKIDKSFIDGIAPGGPEPTLVTAILRLGQAMGLDVVAEGVEDESQVTSLDAMSFPLAQGFFFARPLAPERAEDFISAIRPFTPEPSSA